MKFTLDGKQHELDEETLTFAEGRAIEKVTGIPFGKVGDEAKGGALTPVQAFVWVALKRSEPTLAFSDLDDRSIGDFEFEVESDEDEDETDPTEGADGEADSSTDAPSAVSA